MLAETKLTLLLPQIHYYLTQVVNYLLDHTQRLLRHEIWKIADKELGTGFFSCPRQAQTRFIANTQNTIAMNILDKLWNIL